MAQPYAFTSSGTSDKRSPWQARTTKKAETPTTNAADPWSALASFNSGTKAADLPTYSAPKNPAADTMYASGTTSPTTMTAPDAAANYKTGTQADTKVTTGFTPTWMNTDWSTLRAPASSPYNIDPKTGIQQWLSAMTPYLQTLQNAYQYAQDYNEAQRRYDITQQWTQQNDLYNQGITGRQQNLAEWQATENARQAATVQAYQQQRDAAEMALTNKQTMNQVWGRNVAPNVRWMRSW